jgi:hypothetical protein
MVEGDTMRLDSNTNLRHLVLALMLAVGCGGSGGDRMAVPDTADGTVRVVIDGVVEHQPEIVWRALPQSYQQDVTDLTRDFADTVNPAVFDRAVAVARKGVVVLQSKKHLILGSESFKRSGVDPESVDAFWEASVHMLDAVLASDAADLSTLRELDVEAFLEDTGSVLMDHAALLPAEDEASESFGQKIATLERAEVELTSEDGDRAVVTVAIPDEEPTELRLVRFEERWVPAELAEQWPAMVDAARGRIQALDGDESAQARMQVLFAIGVVEGFVDQIDQMETSEQIDDLIGGVLGNIMRSQGGRAVTGG